MPSSELESGLPDEALAGWHSRFLRKIYHYKITLMS